MTDHPNSIPIEELLGKYILIAITHVDSLGNKTDQIECHGFFDSMDESGIHIRLKDTGEDFMLPPDLSAFQKAQPGEYRLRTTGEVVINPDYLSVWTVQAPGSEQEE